MRVITSTESEAEAIVPIAGVVGIGIIGVIGYYSALLIATSVVTLTFSAISSISSLLYVENSVFSSETLSVFLNNCFLTGVSGVAVGVILGFYLINHSLQSKYATNVFTSFFRKELILNNPIFLYKFILVTMVGLIIGLISGASGAVSLGQAMTGGLTQSIGNSVFAIHSVLGGNGFGGVGGEGGFLAGLFIFLMIIIQSVIIGISSGVLLVALIGMIEALIFHVSYKFFSITVMYTYGYGKTKPSFLRLVFGHIKEGILAGLLTGFIVGLIQGILTLAGYIVS